MRTEESYQMAKIAERIAVKNGVSVREVLTKYSRSVKKKALTRNDFFWGSGDISPANA